VIPEDERLDLILLGQAVRYQSWVVDSFGGALSGDILEIGAGVGNFTRWLAPLANRLVVAEPDPVMAAELAGRVPSEVDVRPIPVEGLADSGERFDAVVAINVLEHIADDRRALEITRGLLRPEGRVCVFLPAHRALFGSLDERYGHLRRYTVPGTSELLRKTGFQVATCRYFNPVGAMGWWLAGRVLRERRLSRASVWISERVAVPVGRALERFGAPPFGQSVLAVGIRP
jgi:SAM-dependent methyltransferase